MSAKDDRGFSLPRSPSRQGAVVAALRALGSGAVEGRDYHVARRSVVLGWAWRAGPKPDTSHLPPYQGPDDDAEIRRIEADRAEARRYGE